MSDIVNHPKHYNRGRIEVIEFLEDQFMERPHEWNAVKYLCRSDLKGSEIQDLEKAIWYINRKIEMLKAQKEGRAMKRPNDMNQRSISVTTVSNLNETDSHQECAPRAPKR